MDERAEHRGNPVWAFCPKCRSTMGQTDIVCPNCGYNFPPDPPPPDVDAVTYQFDIRLLFYLMGLTALIGSTGRLLGRAAWPFAGPMFICGVLIWRMRKVRYAALPGLAVGFAVGRLDDFARSARQDRRRHLPCHNHRMSDQCLAEGVSEIGLSCHCPRYRLDVHYGVVSRGTGQIAGTQSEYWGVRFLMRQFNNWVLR